MIADVTQPWFFSGERAESISGRSRTLSGPSPPKIQKKSGAKKTSVFSVLLCQNIQFFVAGAPDHFCWILGRLGFASFLKGSTLLFTSETEKNANFEGRSRSRMLFFSKENKKNANFEGRSRSRSLFFSRETDENMNFDDC